MRLTRQSRKMTSAQLNLAAMIDVVFLLLIFFMCTSSFRPQENDLPTQLPQVGVGQPDAQPDFDPVRIVVTEAAGGAILTCDGRPCASFDDLAALLIRLRANADYPVIIEGSPGVPFRYMVAALDTCHGADLQRVAFSAKGVGP